MGRLHITPEVDAISFTPQARQVVVQAILAILLARVIAAILIGRRVTRR
jgi:phosphotransferase system  glucose/maltose/N-acetylglucosamine-specific IIC component